MGRHTRQSDDELPRPSEPPENVYSRAYQPPTYGPNAPSYGPDPRVSGPSAPPGVPSGNPYDEERPTAYYGRSPVTEPLPAQSFPAQSFPAVQPSEQPYVSPYTRAYDKIEPLDDRAESEDEEQDKRRGHWLTRVPLLPALAGITAVGMVAAAYGTNNISLNFGGGVTPGQQAGQGDTTRGPKTSRGGGRAGVVTVAFSSVKLATGFKGTVTLHNRGTKVIKTWTLKFHLEGAKVVGVSGGVLAKVSSNATIRQTNSAIAPGATAKVVYTALGAVVTPSGCTFNGASCGTGS